MDKKIACLHCHTGDSPHPGDGASLMVDYFRRAVDIGVTAFSLTEHGLTNSNLKLLQEAPKWGIKPLPGIEFYTVKFLKEDLTPEELQEMQDNPDNTATNHLTCFARTAEGLRQLNTINGIAMEEGFYYRPRVVLDKLFEMCKPQDVIFTSGCMSSHFSRMILDAYERDEHGQIVDKLVDKAKLNQCREEMIRWRDHWGESFFIEIQANELLEQAILTRHQLEFAEELGITTVFAQDCHIAGKGDRDLQIFKHLNRMHKNIQDINDPKFKRLWFYDTEAYMRDYDEIVSVMQTFYISTGIMTKQQMLDCLENTNKVADMVDIRLSFDTFHVPKCVDFDLDKLSDEDYYYKSREIFKKLAFDGLEMRFKTGMADERRREDYVKQLQYEYDVLCEKNFVDYFLIVRDICVDVRCQVPLGLNVGRGCSTPNVPIPVKRYNEIHYVPVEDVVIGDIVFNEIGVESKVLNKFKYDVDEEIVYIENRANLGSEEIGYTKEHLLLVAREWVKASELKAGDWLCLPKFKDKKPNLSSQEELCYLEGRLIGHYLLNPDLENISDIFKSMIREDIIVNAYTGNCSNLLSIFENESIQRFEYIKQDADTFELNWDNINDGYSKKELLRGIFDGLNNLFKIPTQECYVFDGVKTLLEKHEKYFSYLHGINYRLKTKTRNTLYSKSLKFIEQLKVLLWQCGIPSRVITNGKWNSIEVLKGPHSYHVFQDKNFYSATPEYKFDDEYIYIQITDVRIENYTGKVYDLKIEGEYPSYCTADFVQHNSVGGSLIAFCLGIAEVDPLKFGLVFERFLNPKKGGKRRNMSLT